MQAFFEHRDFIAMVCDHVDLQSFGRLGRVCKRYNQECKNIEESLIIRIGYLRWLLSECVHYHALTNGVYHGTLRFYHLIINVQHGTLIGDPFLVNVEAITDPIRAADGWVLSTIVFTDGSSMNKSIRRGVTTYLYYRDALIIKDNRIQFIVVNGLVYRNPFTTLKSHYNWM